MFLSFSFSINFSAYSLETTADEMLIDSEKHIHTLNGNAVAMWDDKVFKADIIVIYKKEDEKMPTKITATGNVSYEEKGLIVMSKYCESDMKIVIFTEKVVLKGDEFGVINADKAVYNIETKKVDITASEKVKLLLNHEQEKVFNRGKKK
jgi:lipopolysaccharide assembly outer membrane protein LptD (OstA)